MKNQKPTTLSRLGIDNKDGELSMSKQSVLGALGGWLGIVESILPPLIFILLLSITKQTVIAVIFAASLSVAFLLIKLIQKKPITQAVAGGVGIAISATLALQGKPSDYFLTGFWTNAIYLSVILLSLLIRWPIVGVLIGVLVGDLKGWRKNKAQMRRFQAATLLWVGLFASRLIVQVPLYFSNQTELLGIFRIAMGVPLYALCIWFTWLLVRGLIKQRQ